MIVVAGAEGARRDEYRAEHRRHHARPPRAWFPRSFGDAFCSSHKRRKRKREEEGAMMLLIVSSIIDDGCEQSTRDESIKAR
jgi:hypothetical protein